MENGSFDDVFPTNKWWYSIAMLVYQRVSVLVYIFIFQSHILPTVQVGMAAVGRHHKAVSSSMEVQMQLITKGPRKVV